MEHNGLAIEAEGQSEDFATSNQALSDRRDLALVALERTRMPMAVSDPRQPDNPIVLANQAFFDLTGYTAEEIVGRNCRFLQGPDTDREVVDRLKQAISEEREIEVELLNYRKDGSQFWNTVFVSPVHNEAGELLYFFASQKDETARRRANDLEAIERKLLKEIDHRAKNALALVQSIVRLTQRNDIQTYAASIEGRVDAIARAHRMLADYNWNDIPIEHLFHGESRLTRGRVALHGPHTMIHAAHVQALSLLIHEVLDNAAKHGALSDDGGTVDVHWESDEEGGGLVINIREHGGPAPDADRKQGLGQKLIERIVTQQLGGTAKFAYDGNGLLSTLTLTGFG